MFKKFVYVLMAILCSFTTLTTIGCGEKESGKLATVWSALASEVFLQDQEIESYPDSKLELVAMKGETESRQVIISANKFIRGFTFETQDLIAEDGSVIAKENVKLYGEHYVEITDLYINTGNTNVTLLNFAGWYPDALVPLDAFCAKRQDRIEAGKNQAVWVDFVIPSTAKAGTYTSTFKLTLGEEKEVVNIPVEVVVYDIEMPYEVNARSAFNIWYSQLASGEKDNYTAETNQIYYDFLLEKRLCSGSIDPNKRSNLDQFVNYMVELASNPRVTTYFIQNNLIGIVNDTFLAEKPPQAVGLSDEEIASRKKQAWDSTYNGLTNIFNKILTKNVTMIESNPEEYANLDMFKKLVFYFHDEPTVGYRSQMVRTFNEILTKAKRDFVSANQSTFEKYPFLQESLLQCVRDMTPTHLLTELAVSKNEDGTPNYEKGDGCTLYVMHCYRFNSSAARALIKQNQSYGEQYWWYTCSRNSPALSYYVESKTMNMRLQGWQQFEYDLSGILYWDIAQWSYFPNNNPYKNWGRGFSEGMLVYPGQPYGLKKPVSSIRMENIFQAQEDYEDLFMLKNFVAEYNEENGTDYDTNAIVGNMIKDMHNGTYITESATPQQLEDCRIRILNILDKFVKGDSAGAINLLQRELA